MGQGTPHLEVYIAPYVIPWGSPTQPGGYPYPQEEGGAGYSEKNRVVSIFEYGISMFE